MAGVRIRLNSRGIAQLLRSQEMAAFVNSTARDIASQAMDGEVTEYTTDRAAASVRVPAEAQAREGALTRAASAVGLTVTAR